MTLSAGVDRLELPAGLLDDQLVQLMVILLFALEDLKAKLLLLRLDRVVKLGNFAQWQHPDPVRSAIGMVTDEFITLLDRFGVQHLAHSHHIGNEVQVLIQVGGSEIGKYGTVVGRFHEGGKAIFGNAHQEALGQGSHPVRIPVVQIEADFRIVPDSVAEVTHAEVQMVRQDLLAGLPSKRSAILRREIISKLDYDALVMRFEECPTYGSGFGIFGTVDMHLVQRDDTDFMWIDR